MNIEPETFGSIIFDKDQAETPLFVHHVRIYGEELWGALRAEKRIKLSIGKIDNAIDRIDFSSRSQIVARRAVKVAERLRAKHLLSATVTMR